MWFDVENEALCTDEELKNFLRSAGHMVVLLDGPTGCGKTMIMKSLAAEESANVGFMSSQILSLSIIDKILHKWDIAKSEYAAYSTLCIEDVDISLHTPSSQTSAAYTVMRACEKQLVVLTGIKCEERIPVLLDTIKSPLRIFRYTAA